MKYHRDYGSGHDFQSSSKLNECLENFYKIAQLENIFIYKEKLSMYSMKIQ